jgi:multiple sugar transport system permease protein
MINKKKAIIKNIITYLLLIFGSFWMLLPFIWMVSTSLKERQNVFLFPPQWIPDPIQWINYPEVIEQIPFVSGLLNSLFVTVTATVGVVVFSAIAAYAFAKIRFKFKEPIFALYLLTMMVPAQTVLIPQFIIFTKIQWIDTYSALIIPFIFTNGFGVFLLRQFFSGVPDALIEAAKIDGCSQPRIFGVIMLPQVKPAIASLVIFTIIARWNDFLWPFILLSSEEKFTLPLVMKNLEGQFGSQWELMMAAATMSLLPIIVVYIFTQRYFVEGITLTGVKG